MNETGISKEKTIRELAAECQFSAGEINGNLHSKFSNPEPTCSECQPVAPLSVLDDIIRILKDCHQEQRDTIIFLDNEVFPKIS